MNYAGIIVGDRRTKSEGCYSRLERWRGTPATLQLSLVGKAQDRRSARAPRVTAHALGHPPTQRCFSWGLQAVSSCSSSGAIETRARERRRAFIISNSGHKRVTRYPELHEQSVPLD